MTRPSLKLLLTSSLICAITFAFTCSFLLVKVSDEAGGLLGNQTVLIDQSTGQTTAVEFREKIVQFAQQNHVDISLILPDPNSPQNKWDLYIASASSTSSGGQWLSQGYPNFSRDTLVTTHSLVDYYINDPRGTFSLNGPPQSDEKFLAMAREHGLNGEIQKANGFNYLRTESSAITLVVIFVLLVVVSAIYAIMRSRHLAIAAMIGQRTLIFVAKEFLDAIARMWIIIIALATVGIGFLGWYNSFHRVGLFITGFLILLATYVVAMFLSCLGMAKLLSITPLIAAIKGAVPGKQLAWSAYAVRFCVVLLTCGLSFTLVSFLVQYSARKNEAPLWQERSGVAALFISGSVRSDYYETLGPALRAAERENKLILAQIGWNLGLYNSPDDLPQLLVNSYYAQRELGLPAGESDVVRVVYPTDASEEDVNKAVTSIAQNDDYRGWRVEKIPQPADFSAFSYESGYSWFSADLMLHRPVVTVLPPGLTKVSDRNLAAWSTQRSVLLKDVATAQQFADDPALQGIIAGWRPVQDQWQAMTAKLGVETRAAVLNIGILLAVLISIVVACALTFSLQFRDRLRACFMVGVSFSRAYLAFIVVEIVFALVPFGYLLRQQTDYHAQLAVGTPRAVELSKSWAVTPNIVAAFAVLVAVSLVVAFWFAYRRYIRAWRAQ